MKKYLLTLLCVTAIFSFFSCGSTPTAEPGIEKQTGDVNLVEEEKKEEEEATEPTSGDFSKANEALLSQAESARQKAIEAGAEEYFPDVLASDDSYFDEVKAAVSANPTEDHSAKITEAISRYNALATASLAKEMKKKADELGLSDEAAEKALADFETSSTGSDMNTNANKAFSAYSTLLVKHLGDMAKSEREAAREAKKKADEVKAGVSRKAEYTEASNTFKKADSAFVTRNVEEAYKGYRTAKNAFLSLYESISEKRAEALAAIERAKQRVAEAEAYTKEADEIAPLQGEVAGIEKEDAVLLEEDNFANPEDAVIDIDNSEEAKKATVIDGAINATVNAIEGEAK